MPAEEGLLPLDSFAGRPVLEWIATPRGEPER